MLTGHKAVTEITLLFTISYSQIKSVSSRRVSEEPSPDGSGLLQKTKAFPVKYTGEKSAINIMDNQI